LLSRVRITQLRVGGGVITTFSHLLLTDPEVTEVEDLAEVFFDKNGE
jgi:hypothetical protein